MSRTPPSNHSSLMYTHVYMKADNDFHCAIGSKCVRVKVTVSKKTVSSSLCPHERIAVLLSDLPQDEEAVPQQTGSRAARTVPKFTDSQWTANTSAYLYQHRKLDMSHRQKKEVERKIRRQVQLAGQDIMNQMRTSAPYVWQIWAPQSSIKVNRALFKRLSDSVTS